MKVKDLIEMLSRFPQDMECIIGLQYEGTENEITTVEAYELNGAVVVDEIANSHLIFDDHLRLGLPSEFVELCERNKTTPREVLHGFIADLCELRNYVNLPRADELSSNGSDERDLADQYFERVGYRYRE